MGVRLGSAIPQNPFEEHELHHRAKVPLEGATIHDYIVPKLSIGRKAYMQRFLHHPVPANDSISHCNGNVFSVGTDPDLYTIDISV